MHETRKPPFAGDSVAIIGVGLLGASLGLALKAHGYAGQILGVGRRQPSLDQAKQLNAVDHTSLDLSHAARCSLIVIATPVSTFPDILQTLAHAGLPDAAILTDVGSTKQSIVLAAQQHLGPDAPRFVGAHPMAGSEQRGPAAARADLFANKPCVITPTSATSPDALAAVEQLWAALGMNITRLAPDQHDLAVARISHLPHILAAAVVHAAHAHGGLDIASTGFADATRIAAGDPDLWADILTDNAPAVRQSLDQALDQLDQLRRALDANDHPAVRRWLAQAADARKAWRAGR